MNAIWKRCPPIEGSRQDRFRPRFCPWEDCPDHTIQGRKFRCVRNGRYFRERDASPQARFECLRCGRGFSIPTFSLTYRMRRPELLQPIAAMLNAGCADRQIARTLDCSKSTVNRIAVKIGEHAKRMQQEMLSRIQEILEAINFDDFETFSGDQTNRLAIGTAVGTETGFVYATGSVRYRGAFRRAHRKRPLRRAGKPTVPGSRIAAITETLLSLASKAPNGLTLITDDSPLYPVALRKVRRMLPTASRIEHNRFANPDRKPGCDRVAARLRDRAMFQVDLLHKLFRHSHAHHRRETIAFARKVYNADVRAALFAIWRNFVKLETERRPTTLTPAMKVGLTDRAWSWAEVLSQRLFGRRIGFGSR